MVSRSPKLIHQLIMIVHHVSKLPQSLPRIVVFLAISILTNQVGALVLPESHALSFSNPNTTMHRLSSGNALPICTKQAAWTLDGQGPGKAACAEFLNQFEMAIASFRLQAFEFVGAGARANPQMRTIRTPKKWTWRE